MKRLLLAFSLLAFSATGICQDTKDDYPSSPSKLKKGNKATATKTDDYPTYNNVKKNLKKFNYFYLRLSYPLPSADFGNPMTAGATNGTGFGFTGKIKHQYKAGLELGAVNHITELGYYMVKLGINYGFNVQMFGPFNDETTNYSVSSDGTYIGTLGLGPQVTFKPVEAVRIGLFARFGLAAIYHTYDNVQNNANRVNLEMYNYGFAKDIGLDFTLKKFSLGFTWSFLKTAPNGGQLFVPDNKEANSYTDKTTTVPNSVPLTHKISFNRAAFNLGFAF
jgi:hypothetical protein